MKPSRGEISSAQGGNLVRKQPNILWLCSDQQRFDTIHALGNAYIDTPSFDRLCHEGVAFTTAYCQNPVCTPSRASFLSGKYPSAVNCNILGGENQPEHCTLLPKALHDAGYYCGNIGKLHISAAWYGYEKRGDDGYDDFIYSLGSGHQLENGISEYANWLIKKGIDWHTLFTNNGGDYYWYREDAPIDLRQTAWCAEEAIHFMEAHRDQPWFLSVNCFDPHPPYDGPKSLTDKYLARGIPEPIYQPEDEQLYSRLPILHPKNKEMRAPDDKMRRDKASYYACVEIVDRHFGWILDAVERLGLKDDTIVLFTSDHGELLGDHGLQLKGCRFYEGAVHVPLIFSCPARFYQGRQVTELAELTDIAPTIAECCGIEFIDTVGHSLLPHLCDCGRTPFQREYVRCEYYASNINADNTFATMFRTERYKLICYHGIDYGELYDMRDDPEERRNLWDDPAYERLRYELVKRSFDVAMVVQRPGQHRVGRY